MKRFIHLLALAIMVILPSCKHREALLPNISGKAGEVVVVMDKENWDGSLGTLVRDILATDCPYLAQKEPLYDLAHVTPSGFSNMFKYHRNILFFTIGENVTDSSAVFRNNVWANPQCVIQISGKTAEMAAGIFDGSKETIISALEQAERDRVIMNSKQYPNAALRNTVMPLFGGAPHFPIGYELKKKTDDFVWIADEKQYTMQGIFMYKYPVESLDNFSMENIIAHRNEFLRENVPGMFDNTWMTTSDYFAPEVEFIRFRGRQFAQTRGFWEVHNDYMGGPFVSHSFYNKDASEIIVVEAFVYAPKYDKRQYLRQVESIIYSFEWAPEPEAKEK